MQIGKCKMCLKEKELCESHLIPSDVYKLCSGGPGLEPIIVTEDVAMFSGRELKTPLLCLNCEEVLNQGGEDWLLPLLPTLQGEFPFFDLLKKGEPEASVKILEAYIPIENKEIRVDQLVHFAAGIFWKASVHPWRAKRTEPWIELGPYSEKVRTFLLGETGFPKNTCMLLSVAPPPVTQITAWLPYRGVAEGYRNYILHIPGLEFTFCVGKIIPAELEACCLASVTGGAILVHDIETRRKKFSGEALQKARKQKRLVEWAKTPLT